MAISLDELAAQLGGEVVGDGQCVIHAVASLRRAKEGDLSFFANVNYRDALAATAASAVIISPKHRHACPVSALVTKNPYAAYAHAVRLLVPERRFAALRHPSACVGADCAIGAGCHIGAHSVIGEGTEIGPDVYIGPGCIVEEECRIGEGSVLVGNCVVRRDTIIGRRALIHPGVVLGSDGFGFARDGGKWVKIPQLGRVVIGDDVEIGSNTTIDRGALDDTVIEDGVKLDNQIQIAHNVAIGAHTAIAGCTGIAGSTRIGRRCAIGGGVGIVGHLQIADDVQITGMTFVTQSITEPGVYSSGTPMEAAHHWRKNFVRMKQLDEMAKRLKEIERDLQRSASRARDQD